MVLLMSGFAVYTFMQGCPEGRIMVLPIPPYQRKLMATKKKTDKVAKVMGEYAEGKLHSGSKKGPVVTSKKQAVAIALSEQRAKDAGKKKK